MERLIVEGRGRFLHDSLIILKKSQNCPYRKQLTKHNIEMNESNTVKQAS